MERYHILREAMTGLNNPFEIDTVAAKESFESRLLDKFKNESDRAQYLSELRKVFEEALLDPEFDWLKNAEETGFTFSDPDPYWNWNYQANVILECKAVFFPFLYPEREITPDELNHVKRVIIFLLLEAEDTAWIHYPTLLTQLKTMKPAWQYLEYYHLDALWGYTWMKFFFHWADKGKSAMRISEVEGHPDLLPDMLKRFKSRPVEYDNPYEGWPPFQDDPSGPYYLYYNKEAWLETIRSLEFPDPLLPGASAV